MLEETHYYPFGLPIHNLGTAAAQQKENRLKYQSNEYTEDNDLRWMNFNARQYDPQIGRFLSIDPLAYVGGQQVHSPYAAMGNNPGMMVDPNGTRSKYANDPMEGENAALSNYHYSKMFGNHKTSNWGNIFSYGMNSKTKVQGSGGSAGGANKKSNISYDYYYQGDDESLLKLNSGFYSSEERQKLITGGAASIDDFGQFLPTISIYDALNIVKLHNHIQQGINSYGSMFSVTDAKFSQQSNGGTFEGNGYDGWVPELGALGNASAWMNNKMIIFGNKLTSVFGNESSWMGADGWKNKGYPTMKYTWGTLATVFTGGAYSLTTARLFNMSISGSATYTQTYLWLWDGASLGVGTYNLLYPNNNNGTKVAPYVDGVDVILKNPFGYMNWGFRGIDYYNFQNSTQIKQ